MCRIFKIRFCYFVSLIFLLASQHLFAQTDLALNKVATASSTIQSALLAVDGNAGTRWESTYTDPSWISVDLAAQYTLGTVVIDWEAANAANYQVQGSNNNSTWTTLATRTGGTFGNRTDTVTVSGTYRYVRIYGTARSAGNNWGYSIFSLKVYAAGATSTSSSSSSSTAAAGNGYTVLNSSSVNFFVNNAPWADIHYTVNGGGQLNIRMTHNSDNSNTYTLNSIPAGAVIKYSFTIGIAAGGQTDTAWVQFNCCTVTSSSSSIVSSKSSVVSVASSNSSTSRSSSSSSISSLTTSVSSTSSSVVTGTIVPLFNSSTVLEPSAVEDTSAALITRFGDRARDRHARESEFHIYDHYLSWYWEQRTATIEIIDKIAKGGNEIVFNIYPQWPLSAPEFRAFFRGINTKAEYHTNISATRVTPLHYTTTLTFNPKENRAIQIGDRVELEVSQFLEAPTHGRANYYGTAVLYIVGQGGLVPWEGQGSNLDSFPLSQAAWMGGRNTLPYQYSNEPLERFKQIPGFMAPGSAQSFMLGRRLHHTDFATGEHSEFPEENPIYTEQVGKLGPQFYASRCVSCHVNNGRAIPPGLNTTITNAVTKVGTSTGAPDVQLGSSLQPLRTSGAGEGSISISSYALTNGTYGDGTSYQLRKPVYTFVGPIPSNFSVRNTPPLVGIGLLESVPENVISALADPSDANGDGISGRMQTVVDPQTGQIRLGRFGWKAGKARISHQIASALTNDMGVTNSIFPQPDCGSAQSGCGSSGVELSDSDLNNMVRYVSLLGVAARRDLNDAQALQGETLFANAGCTGCHKAQLTTSTQHPFAELRNQTIHPYTDLLLHDMGTGLADNLPEASASGAEWRTAPLWSIGLTAGVSGGQEAYLHDGRARNLSEAILWHSGEAEASKEAFRTMSSSNRAALLKFIQSL